MTKPTTASPQPPQCPRLVQAIHVTRYRRRSYFNGRSEQPGVLSVRPAVPAIYHVPEFAAAGGLMSYVAVLQKLFRLVGTYTGGILNGNKPAEAAARWRFHGSSSRIRFAG